MEAGGKWFSPGRNTFRTSTQMTAEVRKAEHSKYLLATYTSFSEHWKAPDGNMGYFFHRQVRLSCSCACSRLTSKDRLLGECVGAQSGSEWRNIRSLFDPIFTIAAMSQHMARLREEIRSWLDSLPTHTSAQDGDPSSFATDMPENCASLPLKLVAMVLYGDALSNEVSVARRFKVIPLG